MSEWGAVLMDEMDLLMGSGGCCKVHNVQFDHYKHGQSVFMCQGCRKEFIEAEDTGNGG
jgi:hypothetical protein